jgi:hypothetical protein
MVPRRPRPSCFRTRRVFTTDARIGVESILERTTAEFIGH